MDPINYSGAFAGLQSPNESFVQGIQGGAAVQELQLKQQQAQLAQQQKVQMQSDLAALSRNPTTQAIGQMSIKYPQLSEQFKRTFDMLEPAQKQSKLEHATQVYAALQNKAPDVAKKILADQVTALRNSGNEQDAKGAETMAALIDAHPEFAQTTAGLMISSAMGPEKFATTFAALGKESRDAAEAPADLRKKVADAGAAESDATTKAVTAKYADQQAVLDLSKKGWDIKAIVEDIDYKKQSNRIAAMNAAANREGNSLKREELRLKIEDAKRGRDEKVRERVAQGETEIAGVTDTKDLIDTILADENSLRAVTGAGAWKGAIPGTVNRSMAGKIEQLVNMAAAMNLDKLKGPMSDKDILFVKRISANLDRYQDEDVFVADLKKFRGITERAEGKLREKYGAPAPAAPPPKPVPKPAAPGSGQNIVVDF